MSGADGLSNQLGQPQGKVPLHLLVVSLRFGLQQVTCSDITKRQGTECPFGPLEPGQAVLKAWATFVSAH